MQQTLTTLSQAYIDGQIDKDNYRQQRRDLIKQFLADDQQRHLTSDHSTCEMQPATTIAPARFPFDFRIKAVAAIAFVAFVVGITMSWQSTNPIEEKYQALMADSRFDLDETQPFRVTWQQSTPEQQQQWLTNAKQQRLQLAESSNPQDFSQYHNLTSLMVELENVHWEQTHAAALKRHNEHVGHSIAEKVSRENKVP